MPYQGSVQSIGFKGRPVADSSKRMRQRAQDLDQRRVNSVNEMTRVAQGQLDELNRVDSLKRQKDKYEIDQLAQFSQTLQDFAETMVTEVVKPAIDAKRQEGIDTYRAQLAGDEEAIAKVKLLHEQVDKVDEQVAEFVKRTGVAADSLEAEEKRASLTQKYRALNVRRLGPNIAWGYRRAALVEAGKGFAPWRDSQLIENNNVIPGTDIKINSYHNLEGPNAHATQTKILNYLEHQYIKDNSSDLDGTSVGPAAVGKYLTSAVVQSNDTFQRQQYEEKKKEVALQQIEDQRVSFVTAVEAGSPEDLIKATQNQLDNGSGYINQSGAIGNPNVLNKALIADNIEKALNSAKSPEQVEELLNALNTHTFTRPDGTQLTLDKMLIGVYDSDAIYANAKKVFTEKWELEQNNGRVAFTQNAQSLQSQVYRGEISMAVYKQQVKLLLAAADQEGLNLPGNLVNTTLTFKPQWQNFSQSETDYKQYSEAYPEGIPVEYVERWDPKFVKKVMEGGEEYPVPIVDRQFANTDKGKDAITAGNTTIENALNGSRDGYTKISHTKNDITKAIKAMQRELPTRAKQIQARYKLGYVDPNGKKHDPEEISDAKAVELAASELVAEFERENAANNRNYDYYQNAEGLFIHFLEDKGQATETELRRKHNTRLDKIALKIAKAPQGTNILLSKEKLVPNPDELEITGTGEPPPIVKDIAAVLGKSNWEVLNLLRAQHGLPPAPLPEGLDSIKSQPPSVQAELSKTSAFSKHRAMDAMGTVNTHNMILALGGMEKLTLTNQERVKLLKESGVNKDGPNVDEKLMEYKVNQYLKEAAKLTDNKDTMIKMVTAKMNTDDYQKWFHPDHLATNQAAVNSYYNGGSVDPSKLDPSQDVQALENWKTEEGRKNVNYKRGILGTIFGTGFGGSILFGEQMEVK